MLNSVFRKYAATFCSTVVLLLGVVVIVDYLVGSSEARDQAERLQFAEARAGASELNANFRGIEAAQSELSKLPWVKSHLYGDSLQEELRRFLKLQPLVWQVVHANATQPPTAFRVSRTQLDGAYSIEEETLQTMGTSNAFRYGPVRHRDEGKFVELLKRSDDNSAVFLVSTIDLRFVDSIVRTLKFGETGMVYLVDENDRVVAHRESQYALRETSVQSLWKNRGWDAKAAGATLPFVEGQSLAGRAIMAAAVKIEPQGWWLVAEQESDEAMAPVRRQLFRNGFSLIVGTLLSALMAYLLARRWSRPIKTLSLAAGKFSKGNFSERIVSSSNDELGELGRSFNSMASELQGLTTNLEQKIAEKTSQLESEFVTRETQSKEIVKLEERARIMRDFHDGVGGHLVGLLGAAKRDALDASQIEAMVNDALIDFRIAIDSLSPEETDLTTALAGLRFRLLPRLQAAGLESAWSLEGLPGHLDFSREVIFHVQRIVAEAITNVIKHAQASRVDIAARIDAELNALVLEVKDDGVGFVPRARAGGGGSAAGRGVVNILQRATLIGGDAKWATQSSAGAHGTVLRVWVPLPSG